MYFEKTGSLRLADLIYSSLAALYQTLASPRSIQLGIKL